MESLGLKPRGYQLEVLERARQENTIIFMDTGCGKTLIAVMLILDASDRIRKPAGSIAVFLAPSVPLVQQQAEVIKSFTDLKVGCYWGGVSPERWSHAQWKEEVEKKEVFVMTPQLLLTNLRHCFLKMDIIELLIFDECHHAHKKHPYAAIMNEFYFSQSSSCPRVFGMTASPIIGKGGTTTSECAVMFSDLECQLHSKVYTVDDRKELDLINPLPTLRCEYYDATYLAHDLGLQSTLEALKVKHLRPLTDFEERLSTEGGEPLKLVLKRRKELIKVFGTLKYCLEELGLWCTQKAAKLLGSDDEFDLESTKLGCKSRKGFLQDVHSMVKAARSKECSPEITVDDFSSKVQALLDVLQQYQDDGLKCIIFVERVMAARVLAELLAILSNFHFVRCKYLAGNNSSLASMSRNQQQCLVEQFRSGEINVLVATNIAEEGLDVQSCGLIVRFDLPPTVRSFIQSRGRARRHGSTYVLLCERGSTEKDAHMKTLLLSESVMNEQASLRGEGPSDLPFPVSTDLETYCVPRTGAIVNTDSSVSLLYQYCAKLPGDKFYSPAPDFSVTETQTWGVSCTVMLPPNAPFRVIVGRECETNTRAKQVACLEACKQLHACGALTDSLLPAYDSENDEEEKPFGIRKKTTTGPNPEELYPSAVPCGLSGSLVAQVCFHTYRICMAPNPSHTEYAEFALYLECALDSELETMELTLDLSKQRSVTIKLLPCGVVHLTQHQIEDGKRFQTYVLSTILDRDGLQSDQVCLGGRTLPLMDAWDESMSYLLLPLTVSTSSRDGGQVEIDWLTIKKVLSTSGLNSRGFPESEAPVYKVIVKEIGLNVQTLQVADGLASVEDIIGAVVVVNHETDRKYYYILDVIQEWNSYSRFNSPEYASYVEYFKLRHGETLLYPEQCLLRASPLRGPRNLLISRSTGAASPTAVKSTKSKLVELPPELCKIRMLGFSACLVNGVYLLPSIMHRLESMLIAKELRDRMAPAISETGKIPIMKILQCLTTANCMESFNLERLELLGDSFLKFAVSQRLFLVYENRHEGQLSCRRARSICNSALHQLGVARGIPAFIRDEQFVPKDWAAPGRWCRVVCDPCASAMLHAKGNEEASECVKSAPRRRRNVRCSAGHRWMHQKTVADAVEALIGMHFVEGGPDICLAFMGWMGIAVNFDPALKLQAQNCIEARGDPKLELSLAYTFRNKALMVQAITHASHSDPAFGCYQRLEFLGDAVLDFLITKHLYTNFPELKPGLLTDLRSASVNNDHFARVAVRHNLHKFLRYNSGSLSKQLREFVSLLQDNLLETWEGDKAPKVLGDLVESLAGAVLVDTNFDIDKVWAVFEPLLQPIATPETLTIHPVRELQELCQSNAWGTPEYKTHLGDNLVSVSATLTVKDATITGNGEKMDGASAKRVAAQDALNQLKSKGFQHLRHELIDALNSVRRRNEGKDGEKRGTGEGSRTVTAASMSEEMVDVSKSEKPVMSVMEKRPVSMDNSYSESFQEMHSSGSISHSGVEGNGGGDIQTRNHKRSENGQSASDSAEHDAPPLKRQSAHRAKLSIATDPIHATTGTVRPPPVDCKVRSQVRNGALDSSYSGLGQGTAAVDGLLYLKDLMMRKRQQPMSSNLDMGGCKLQTSVSPSVASTIIGTANEVGSKSGHPKPAVSEFGTTTDFMSGIPASDYAPFLRLWSQQDGSRPQASETPCEVAGTINRRGVESDCAGDIQMRNYKPSENGETAGADSPEHDAPSLKMQSAHRAQVGEVPDPIRHGSTETLRPTPVDCKEGSHVRKGLSDSSSSGLGHSIAAGDPLLYLKDPMIKKKQELEQADQKSGCPKPATSECQTPLASMTGMPAVDYAPFLRQWSEQDRIRPQASKTQSAPDPVPNQEIHPGYYRSRLYEICAQKRLPCPDFRPLNRENDSIPMQFHFEVGVAVPSMQTVFCEGSKLLSKKAAMESAAKTAVEYLASLKIS